MTTVEKGDRTITKYKAAFKIILILMEISKTQRRMKIDENI